MSIPVRDYTFESFNSKLEELSRYHLQSAQGKLGVNFFTIDAESTEAVIHILKDAGFEVEPHGDILFLKYNYQKYDKKMESVQYAYFYPDLILVVFALKSMDYYDSPLRWIADKERGLAPLKFLPPAFNGLIERALSFPDAQIGKFKGMKVGTFQSNGEKRPRIQKRRIIYEAPDGEMALEEFKYGYSIVPTQVTFWIPNKVTFTAYEDGRFILKEGSYDFFRHEIVEPTLESALQPVRDHKKAKLRLIDVGRWTEIERVFMMFTIREGYEYEEFDEFLSLLKSSGFFPFNEVKREGSVIYRSFLSDEKAGAVLSFYSDGQHFVLSPKFGHGLHSLLRFYEFLLQEVDMGTEYTVEP